MTITRGYAAFKSGAVLKPFEFCRRELRNDDVELDILYSGVCHSDLHMVRDDWGVSTYPLVPGHEIVGRVTALGVDVTRHKIGDIVGVGCMVDSCGTCDQCLKGDEQYCRNTATQTYAGKNRITGDITYGGYAKTLVVNEKFALSVPDSLDLSRVAPILCAGITTYKPLVNFKAGPGKRVNVIGLGGLGHMAVKLAVAMGADVTVIGRNKTKKSDALGLGATDFLDSNDEKAMVAALNKFDIVIDTIPVQHDLSPYMPLLDVDGALVMVGHIGELDDMSNLPMIFGRRILTGSNIGGIAATQELLNFCGEKNTLPDCEVIRLENINEAFDRMENSDVKYRFVIDMKAF